MKRFTTIIVCLLMAVLLCACGSTVEIPKDEPIFEGDWYSADDAKLYQFSDGAIICEESHYKLFPLEDGRMQVGAYDICDGYIDAFIMGIGGYDEMKPIYFVELNEGDALCDSADGSGRTLFYKDESVASSSALEKAGEFEKWMQEYEQTVPTENGEILYTTYDSIVAGKHTNQIVSIDAVISSLEYDNSFREYSFDLWYWSDNENRYIQDKYFTISEENYPEEVVGAFGNYDDGDKIKITFRINRDNSFGTSGVIASELLQKSELGDYGIICDEFEPNETLDSSERYVYITASGNKFHTATCRFVRESGKEIRYTDAISSGYTPCGVCNPTP